MLFEGGTGTIAIDVRVSPGRCRSTASLCSPIDAVRYETFQLPRFSNAIGRDEFAIDAFRFSAIWPTPGNARR